MADLTVLDTGLSSNASAELRPAPGRSRHRDGTRAHSDVRNGGFVGTTSMADALRPFANE